MSAAQNLAYASIQVLHNFGAAATIGGALAATRCNGAATRKKLAALVLGGWTVQAVSGAAFGLTSYLFYHHLPDIAGIAVAALATKMICAATGFLLAAAYLFQGTSWPDKAQRAVWNVSAILAAVALSAAAFLRWFS